MLTLSNIVKEYPTATTTVHALRGISLTFRENEFVAVLGPSGCGKTTLLNIIGGLDRYTSGDLVIGGVSTATFDDLHWDAYRNATIGFVFQSYNLIPHLTVLENVELALSLAGEKKKARREKAVAALYRVGMGEEINKRPNQLSGGQMQRVAIARAIVNNPKIILADEPTGALDSELSVQVMDILREISNDRLVIMVTHNSDLANAYCSRICRFKDGMLIEDTNPFEPEAEHAEDDDTLDAIKETLTAEIDDINYRSDNIDEASEAEPTATVKQKKMSNRKRKKEMRQLDSSTMSLFEKLGLNNLSKRSRKEKKSKAFKPTSMGLGMAFGLSLRNLISKKRRTFFTSFAGSIGIIGLGLVLSISNGFSIFVDKMQTEMLVGVPVGIYEYNVEVSAVSNMMSALGQTNLDPSKAYPDDNHVVVGDTQGSGGMGGLVDALISSFFSNITRNELSEDFDNYIKKMPKENYSAISTFYGTRFNLLAKTYDEDGNDLYLDISQRPDASSALTIATTVLGDNGLQTKYWQQMVGDEENMKKSYDVLQGHYPSNKNEIVLCVDESNGIDQQLLDAFGIKLYKRNDDGTLYRDNAGKPVAIDKSEITFDDFMGLEFLIAGNDDYYQEPTADEYYDPDSFQITNISNDRIGKYQDEGDGSYIRQLYNKLKDNEEAKLKIVGVIRPKKDAEAQYIAGGAICYTPELGQYNLDRAYASKIAVRQRELMASSSSSAEGMTVFGNRLKDSVLEENSKITEGITNSLDYTCFIKAIGATKTATYYNFFPTTYKQKQAIGDYIGAWNDEHPRADGNKAKASVGYFDVSEMIVYNINIILDLVSAMLVAVASISLVVSTVMIGVITSNSVIERTREIGILRSLGARKRDIRHVFIAETSLIGLAGGIIGIVITYVLCPIISAIIGATVGVGSLLHFHPLHALLLVALSFLLTVVSGILPAIGASRKNVVDALRIE